VPDLLLLKGEYDQMLTSATDRMPDMGGSVGDQAGLFANMARYGGDHGRAVREAVSSASAAEKEERWSDCIAAWRLVLKMFPHALLKTRSGFWLARAADYGKDGLWDQAITEADRSLTEDPDNEQAKALKAEAASNKAKARVRPMGEQKKASHPPERPVSSTMLVQPADPNEEAAIKTLLSGGITFMPNGEVKFDTAGVNELLALAGQVRREIKAMDLILSPKASQDYMASVDDFWKKAAEIPGEFGDRVRVGAWQVVESQLVMIADTTIKGMILSSSPTQQARARREFIKLISRIDGVTAGKASASSGQSELRKRVSLFFDDGFFNDALLTEQVGDDVFLENRIVWIKELFGKIREKRGMKLDSPVKE
ncbi:MAG: hypothetical protein WCL44_13370, partial [bacterium]